MKNKLDRAEQSIENNIQQYEQVSAGEKKRIDNILARAKKARNINIRINDQDLREIRERAEQEGLPYQTFIASILHKFISNQLIDTRNIQHALKAFSPKRT
jgi:predicted DNA binding CopG/RHH family protein